MGLELAARSAGTEAAVGFSPTVRTGRGASTSSPLTRLRIDSGVLGVLLFLGTEAMLFAGFVSAFLILRAGSESWPPPGQPRLPAAVTGANTLVLLLSGGTMQRARAAIRGGRADELTRWLAVTALLGALFLEVQGTEWVRLVHYGLGMTASLYGGTFYALIGCHALHVLGALIALLVVFGRAARGRYSAYAHAGVEMCRLYWFFVVGVWPILYALVYLA